MYWNKPTHNSCSRAARTIILVSKCRFGGSRNPVVMMISWFRDSIMSKFKMATKMATKNVILLRNNTHYRCKFLNQNIKPLQRKSVHYYECRTLYKVYFILHYIYWKLQYIAWFPQPILHNSMYIIGFWIHNI